ncbi:hypothetical protein N7G274_004520 [Stereocaulon virgatum]|uniref:Uncharacterized protein n=1 Tax=Stereocaulon virgatum TaxID=373712 RepID=A0ABR4ABD1_9LECA
MATPVYLDIAPVLATNTPFGCPHILDIPSLYTKPLYHHLHIADIIATILYTHNPSTLSSFFDLEKPFRFQASHPSEDSEFTIIREGRTVRCGYQQVGNWFGQAWDEEHVYRMGVDARDPWVACSLKGHGVKIVSEDSVLKWGEKFCFHLIKQRGELFGVNPEGLMNPEVA